MRKPGDDRPHRSLLRRVSLFFVPGFFRRFDSYLLQNRPLIWRSRVHYMIVLSLVLANPLLFLLGFFYPVNRQNAPTIEDVANLVAMLHLMGAAVLLYWAYLQYRHPMGVWTIWKYLLTWMLYTPCIFSVIINPVSFALPVVYHIAAVVPADSFISDYEFHERYSFWYCHAGLTEDLVETYRPRIQHDLEKYGLESVFTFSQYGFLCDAPSLDFLTPGGYLSTPLFGDRLQSIKAAQQFVMNRSGVFFDAYVWSMATYFCLSLGFSGVLLAATIPRHVWFRTFEYYGIHKSLPDIRLPQPPFLSRLDQRLLVAHPLVWSTRAHSFVFNSTVYAIVVATIVVGMSLPQQPSHLRVSHEYILKTSIIIGVMILGALPAIIWAYEQAKHPICTSTTWRSQLVLVLYIVLSLYVSHLMGIMIYCFRSDVRFLEDAIGITFMFSLGSFSLVGLGFLRKYGTFSEVSVVFFALLAVFVATIMLMFIIANYSNRTELGVAMNSTVWFAFSSALIIGNMRKRATRILAALARIYIAVLPASLFFIGCVLDITATDLFPSSFSKAAAKACAFGVTMLCAILLYGILRIPATRMLVNHKYQPKDR